MSDGALFPSLLGPRWEALPPSLRAMHGGLRPVRARGRVKVEGDPRWRARLLRALFRLPVPAVDVPLDVEIRPHAATETWSRRFPSGVMRSTLRRSSRWPGAFEESIGAARFVFVPECDGRALRWATRDVRLFGVSLPLRWFDGLSACCSERDGRYRFDIVARLPWVGVLVAYAGWLESVDGD